MKIITLFLLLSTTVSYPQSEKQLIEDNCNCINKIDLTLDQEEKKKLIMDCTLNAFKQNKSYTEKVVKKYTGKTNIDGNDVFKYHQDVFNDIMTDNCTAYRNLISEIMGTKSENKIIEKVGLEICNKLSNPLSQNNIKSTIDNITGANYGEISKTYSKDEGEKYISDLKEYLIYNCGKYRQYVERSEK